MVPPCSDRISRVPPYSRIDCSGRIRGYHPLWPAFPDRSAYKQSTTGLLRVRSPLLAESLLMSVPPGTEMFQFPGFASSTYVFSEQYPIGVGCPIRISTDQCLLAAPRGFSQRATSFIASWCQGIHRMPFLRSKSTHHAQEPSSPIAGCEPRRTRQASNYAHATAHRHHAACVATPLNAVAIGRGQPALACRLPVRRATDGAPRDAPEPDLP